MPLASLALLLAGASVALSVAVAVVLLRDPLIDRVLRWTAIALLAAGAGYNLVAGPAFELLPPGLAPALRVFAACGVVLLWSAVRLLFDAGYARRDALWQPAAIALVGMVLPALLAAAWPEVKPAAADLTALTAAALATHLLWMLVAGRRDDLDAYRRLLRLLMAGGGAVYVGIVLIAFVLGARDGRPVHAALWIAGGQILFKLAWLVLAVGQPSPLTRLFRTTHAAEPSPMQPLHSGDTGAEPVVGADAHAGIGAALAARQARQLLDAMEAGLYRRPGLSIGELAEQLQIPEHRLRVVINGHLGFRNYTAFLNHFRLREVATRLRAPDDAHLPILSIALDAGYASIGPFNRAFRDAYGLTPSDYRRAPAPALAEPSA